MSTSAQRNSEQMSDPRGEREVEMSHYCLGIGTVNLAQIGTSVGRVRTSAARSVTQISHTSSNPGCQKPIASQSRRGGLRCEEEGDVTKLTAVQEMTAGGAGHSGVRWCRKPWQPVRTSRPNFSSSQQQIASHHQENPGSLHTTQTSQDGYYYCDADIISMFSTM